MNKLNTMDSSVNTKLDEIGDGFERIDVPEPTRRGRKKKEVEIKPILTVEQVSMVTTGLFVILQGFTKLPLQTTDKKLKAGFDDAVTLCANQYIPEDYHKYVPLAQVGLSMAYIVLDAYERKRKGQSGNEQSEQQ